MDGQILEEGISEAGAIASWTAAATSYSVHGLAMLPFYIYYSMFGFQRVGDAIWAAADQRARGFLLGATSGRTTLGGEVCVPAPGALRADGSVDILAMATKLGMPVVSDEQRGLWALGPATATGRALSTAAAADPELIDRGGNPFRLSSLHGRKVLLVAWSSY